MKAKDIGKPSQIKITIEELDYLIALKDSAEWDVFKKMCERYIDYVQKATFWIPYDDPNFLPKHSDAIGQVYGIRHMVELIEESARKKEVVK